MVEMSNVMSPRGDLARLVWRGHEAACARVGDNAAHGARFERDVIRLERGRAGRVLVRTAVRPSKTIAQLLACGVHGA